MLNPELKRAIVKAALDGLGRNEIHRSLRRRARKKLSSSTVTRALDEFSDLVDNEGLEKAGEVYGVNKDLEELLQIARIKHENGVQTADMVSGAKLHSALRQLELDSEDLEMLGVLVNSIYKKISKENISIQDLIFRAKEIQVLEEKYGVGFEELKEDYERIATTLPKLRMEKKELGVQITTKKGHLDDLFRKHNIEKARVEHNEELEANLREYDIDLDKMDEGCRNFLRLVEENRRDAKKLIERMKIIVDLDGEVASLHAAIKSQKDTEERLKQSIKRFSEQKDLLQNEVKEAENLRETGFTISLLQKMRNSVVQVSLRQDIPRPKAIARFEEDVLENYDPLLGLQRDISKLSGEKDRILREMSEARKEGERTKLENEKELRKVQAEYDAKKGEIEAYSMLRSKGISDEVLMAWGRIITKTSLTLPVVEAELKSVLSLSKQMGELKSQVEELAKQEKILLAEIGELESQKKSLDGTMTLARSALVDLTKDAAERVKTLLNQAGPAMEKLTGSMEAAREIGKIEALLPIWQLMYGKVSKPELEGMMRVILEKYRNWTLENDSTNSQLLVSIGTLISNLSGPPASVEVVG